MEAGNDNVLLRTVVEHPHPASLLQQLLSFYYPGSEHLMHAVVLSNNASVIITVLVVMCNGIGSPPAIIVL